MKLEEYRPPAKVRLAALWASTMFCYIYGDYFGLFVAGTLKQMGDGIMGPLGPATPTILTAVSVMMAVPSAMIILSLVLPTTVSRWSNILLGLIYSAIMAVSLPGSEPFYIVLGVIEMALTLAVALTALRWPRATNGPQP